MTPNLFARLIGRLLRENERCSRRVRLRLKARSLRQSQAEFEVPNNPEDWERVYLRGIVPVTRLESPVARVLAEMTSPGDLLLEAGCGSAAVSAELAHSGRQIELADFSSRILDRASALFKASHLPPPKLTVCDLTQQLPWAARSVDVTWSSGVLEHWTDSELVPIMGEMRRISKKAVISLVPNARCAFYRAAKALAERSRVWPFGRELPRHTLRHVFEKAGLHGICEKDVCPEWAPGLLSLTDPEVQRLIVEWWNGLDEDDPVRKGQGYMLFTIGYC